MAPWPWLQSKRQSLPLSSRRKPLSMIPITIAFVTSFLLLLYSTFHLNTVFLRKNSPSSSPPLAFFVVKSNNNNYYFLSDYLEGYSSQNQNGSVFLLSAATNDDHNDDEDDDDDDDNGKNNAASPSDGQLLVALDSSTGSSKYMQHNNPDVFHDKEIFLHSYKEMKRSLKIYMYPPKENDPFANVFLPQSDQTPGGNYASEAYFKNVLFKSHFLTEDPAEASLFFLPFSIASLRHDRRVGVGGLQDFIKQYMMSIVQDYPYWNRTGGADHFYVACHSIGRVAMEKVEQVKANAIQVVCSSSYFLPNYFAHKDVCLPQIWPRHEDPPDLDNLSKRKRLAFFAGAMNSPVRKALLRVWQNDSSIFAHEGRLTTPYSEQLLRSKYCLHVKGFEVNTARIGDALYYGCVPVILADYYDLPFMDILNWRSFSVVVLTSDVPHLKKILEGISPEEYSALQANVLKVRRHFQWNATPLDFDAFCMVMYELWLRRSSIRIMP